MNKKFEKYYWIAGTVGVTLVVFILVIVFIIVPSFENISQVSSDLKNQKANLNVLEKKLATLKDLKVKEDELKKQSGIVYRAIPTKQEVGDSFIQLDGLIHEAGGSNQKVAGSNGTNNASTSSSTSSSSEQISLPPGVKTLVYTTDITFPAYQNFKDLLVNSEDALRFVHLSDFKITDDQGFKVSLSYTAYYREESDNTNQAGQGEGLLK